MHSLAACAIVVSSQFVMLGVLLEQQPGQWPYIFQNIWRSHWMQIQIDSEHACSGVEVNSGKLGNACVFWKNNYTETPGSMNRPVTSSSFLCYSRTPFFYTILGPCFPFLQKGRIGRHNHFTYTTNRLSFGSRLSWASWKSHSSLCSPFPYWTSLPRQSSFTLKITE